MHTAPRRPPAMALVAVSAISLLAANSVFGYIIRSSLWRVPSPEGAERARPLSADVFPASWTSTFNTTRGQKDVSFMRSIAQRRGMSLWAVRNGTVRCEHGSCVPADWHWADFAGRILPAAAAQARLERPVHFLMHAFDEALTPFRGGGCLDPAREDLFKHVLRQGHLRLTDAEAAQVVILSPAKISGCHSDLLYPYKEIVRSRFEEHESETDGRPEPFDRTEVPWGARDDAILWRGSGTGGGGGDNHRVRVVRAMRALALRQPAGAAVPNVGFHVSNPFSEGLVLGRVNFTDFAHSKYVLDLGGFSYSRRIPYVGQLNSTLVILNVFDDLVMLALNPGRHYVRIHALDDLGEFQNPTKYALVASGTLPVDELARRMGLLGAQRIWEATSNAALVAYTRSMLEHLDRACSFVAGGTS